MQMKKGDLVRVDLSRAGEDVQKQAVGEFDGKVGRISLYKTIKTSAYVQIEGFRSDKGVPLSFMPEWVVPVKDGEANEDNTETEGA